MTSDDETSRSSPGYRLETAGEGLLALYRADGSAEALFEFSAFGPTPQSMCGAVEEDLRILGRDE